MKKALSFLLVTVFLLYCTACGGNAPGETHPETVAATEPSVTDPAEEFAGIEGWDLTNAQSELLCDGILYRQLLFRDRNNDAHIAYVLQIDPQKAVLHKGTANNELSLLPSDRQTVLGHMRASVADGLPVVAAVNGDFFAIGSTFIPSGLAVKNGVLLQENKSFRPFCAITKDGDYIVSNGKTDKVDISTLEMATGGSHMLVRDGVLQSIEQTSDLSTISHPRTLSGVREDKTLLLVVIDGRQPELSNGATLTQCAQLMYCLGAVQAINHDGGGSSTMILRRGDSYDVVNSPSDGELRKVYCSIQVVLK